MKYLKVYFFILNFLFIFNQTALSGSGKSRTQQKEDEKKNARLKKEKADLITKKEKLKNTVANTNKEISNLKKEKDTLAIQVTSLEVKYNTVKSQYDALESYSSIYKRIEEDYKKQVDSILNETNKIIKQNNDISKEIEVLKISFNERSTFLEDLNRFIGYLNQNTEDIPETDILEGVSFQLKIPFKKEYGFNITLKDHPSWLNINSNNQVIFGNPWEGSSFPEKVQFHLLISRKNLNKKIGPFTLVLKRKDPLIQFAWHLKNTGQKNFAKKSGVAGEDINLVNTIDSNILGENIEIAVSDSGVEDTHEDLKDSMLPPNRSRYYGSSNPEDWPGSSQYEGMGSHGTSVAGIIAASGWNKKGSQGVAPKSKLGGLSYLCSGCQNWSSMIDQITAPNYDIFNYSYGYPQCTLVGLRSFIEDYFKDQAQIGRDGKGAIFVKSSGNSYMDSLKSCWSSFDNQFGSPYYLGNANFDGFNTAPYLIVIGALRANGLRATYSSPGSNLWVSAPAGQFGNNYPAILTTTLAGVGRGYVFNRSFPKGHPDYDPDGNYTTIFNGTSSAAPMTSGAIALILSANPSLTWRDVKYILAKTADKVDSNDEGQNNHPLGKNLNGHKYRDGWVVNAAGNSFNNFYGFGRVNVDKAVTMAKNLSHTFSTLQIIEHNRPSIDLSVPDNLSSGATVEIKDENGLTIEAVRLEINISHTRASDVGIEVISPSGTKSILLPINSHIVDKDIENHGFLTNAFFEESSSGTWKIKVIDGQEGHPTLINDIKLKIWGHKK